MRLGEGHKTRVNECLSCGMVLDGATAILEYGFDATPDSGDITVCIFCGNIMAFAGDLTLRELTDQEVRDVAGDGRLIAIQRARAKVKPIGRS